MLPVVSVSGNVDVIVHVSSCCWTCGCFSLLLLRFVPLIVNVGGCGVLMLLCSKL